MIDSITRITLNLQETNTMVSIRAKRGDTGRKLLIHLSDGSIPYHISDDCYATFTAKKPDGTKINNACTIENNVIEYEFTDQTCTAVGTMKAEIRLYGADDKMITSACFLVNVYDTVFRDGDEVDSEGEMNTLDDLILRANAFLNETGKLLRWQGNWDSETEYEANDLVLHEEVLYVAEEAIAAGTAPGSEEVTAWVPIAGMGTGSGADLTEQVDRAEAAAQNAESAAATANNARTQAQAAANSAGVYVGNAVAAMNNANAAAATAEAAKESVSTSVNLAGGYASTAHSSANRAEQANNSAQGYASSASSSATRAEEAAARAEEAAESMNGSGGNVDLSAYVQSVNGQTPDKNGNVEIEIPEGFSGSWNDLMDKPFGEGYTKGETLTKEFGQAEENGYWKFSDDVPTLSDLADGVVVTLSNSETGETISYECYSVFEDVGCISIMEGDYMWPIYVAPSDGVMNSFTTFQTAGIYVYGDCYFFEEPTTISLTIPGYEFTTQELTIKPLDEKYIPDTIARKTDIPESSGNVEFADSIEECTDTTKLYVLPDGYIYAYMTKENVPLFTNQLKNAIDTDGTKYNGGLGYKTGWRFNSSKQEVEAEGQLITGYIPYTAGQVIRISGFNTSDKPNGYFQVCYGDFNVGFNGQMQQMDGNADGLTYGPDPVVSGAYMLTIDPATVTDTYLAPALLDSNTVYIRVNISGYNLSALKVTLDEEISYGTTSGWTNTGHAFIPGGYEDRFATIEEQIASLAEGGNTLIPDYVIAEAESVIDRVIAAQSGRTFTFAALTDMHHGVWNYTDGVVHACQALKYISERINLDAVAVLGDYTDGYPDSGYDDAVADFRAVNNILDDLRFAPNLRIAGNHDIYNENPALTMRYINAYSDDVVWGSRQGGYYYRDFGGYKIRVIGLNTNVADVEQYNWLVSALDLSDKSDVKDWSILVLSHHPLDWHPGDEVYRYCYILDGYRNGTSGTADGVSFDFTGGKNAAKLIGNIHGHLHNFKVDKIYVGNVNSGEQSDVIRIATPNSCYNRENEYEGVWADETAYHKTQNSAEDTSFCVYCIDLDACTIKAVCYGAGYDREIDYSYTNDVTPPVKPVMDTETWTFELEDGSAVSKQVVVMV